MMRILFVGVCLLAGCLQSSVAEKPAQRLSMEKDKYLVVALVERQSPFFAAAEALADRHQAEIVTISPRDLDALPTHLHKIQPTLVAYVVEPAVLEVNLVQRLLKISTEVDQDPFVDFAYGFITGRDSDAAMKLVSSSGEPKFTKPSIAMLGVGGMPGSKSSRASTAWPLKKGSIPVIAYTCVGETDEGRDDDFIAKSLPQLSGTPIILLVSHGYPNGLVGGPKANDLHGTDLSGSVVLNIACYNGVTKTWYEEDYQSFTLRRREVEPEQSFCLQMIDAGAAAYFGYVTPRPAGPLMMGDAMKIASQGLALGKLHQDNLNSVVLAHLMAGDDTVQVAALQEGTEINRSRTAAEVVQAMSMGGVLIGDPAFVPFAPKPDSDPRETKIHEAEMGWLVDVNVGSAVPHFYAAEQINYWSGSQPAMRIETRIPLADRIVQRVNVTELPYGVKQAKLTAAIEEDCGSRYLRLKIVFAQPEDMRLLQQLVQRGLHAKFEVQTMNSAVAENDRIIFRQDIDP